MADAEPRAALAAAQHALLAALVAGAQPPPGFDAGQLRLQARALLAKRARTASAHHPWLAEALGADYLPGFSRYALSRPKPAGVSGHGDASAFETYLRERGELPKQPGAGLLARLRRR